MRYGQNEHRPPATLRFNATPLIDVIFLLTIFFLLVTRFSSAEQIKMLLPKPENSQARVTKMPERVVINCRASDDAARSALYSVGPNPPEPLSVISERLAALKRSSPDVKVVVRADRRLRYAAVRAVMHVVARQGIEMLSVVAHVAEGD